MKKILFAALLVLALPLASARADDCKDGCSLGSPAPAPADPFHYGSLTRYSDGTIAVEWPSWYGYSLSARGNESGPNGIMVCNRLTAKFVFAGTAMQVNPEALVTFPAKADGTPINEPRFINNGILTEFILRVICRAN